MTMYAAGLRVSEVDFMKKVCLLFLAVLLLINLSTPAMGTLLTDAEYACPICGKKDYYTVIVSYGGYIYYGLSRFQYVFWPFTESESLYACQKCNFTCLMCDFGKFPKEKIPIVKKALEGVSLPKPVVKEERDNLFRQGTYYFIPMSARIPVAERVYEALGMSDSEWCLFYRMAAYHYDEADMPDKAAESRRKALEYAERLIADKSQEGLLKESYLISGAMRHFLKDFDGARKDFEKGKAAPYKNPSLSTDDAKGNEKYLNDLIDQFLDSPGEEIDLILAIGSGKLQSAVEILDRNPNLVNKSVKREGYERDEGGTPLHFAVKKGKPEMIKLLIEKGADVNAKDEQGDTPLFAAVCSYSEKIKPLELMKILLDNGADIHARNNKGMTPLIYSVRFISSRDEGDEIRFLISRGAEVNVKDNDGMTPLHYAVLNNNEKVVQLFISKGADISAKTKKGNTPMMCAEKKGLKDMVELLRRLGAKE